MEKKTYEIQIENANVCGQVINGTIEVEFSNDWMDFYTDENSIARQLDVYDEYSACPYYDRIEWVEFFYEVVGKKMLELARSLYPDEEWVFAFRPDGLNVEAKTKRNGIKVSHKEIDGVKLFRVEIENYKFSSEDARALLGKSYSGVAYFQMWDEGKRMKWYSTVCCFCELFGIDGLWGHVFAGHIEKKELTKFVTEVISAIKDYCQENIPVDGHFWRCDIEERNGSEIASITVQ